MNKYDKLALVLLSALLFMIALPFYWTPPVDNSHWVEPFPVLDLRIDDKVGGNYVVQLYYISWNVERYGIDEAA